MPKGMSIKNLPATRDALFSQRVLSQPDFGLVTKSTFRTKSTPAWNQGIADGKWLFCFQTLTIHAQLLVSAGSPMIHAWTNNFRLTSGEVFNYCINWSKASFAFWIADIQEENNALHICWLCCNDISKHLGWHENEQAFVVWFWQSHDVWIYYIFVNPCTQRIVIPCSILWWSQSLLLLIYMPIT